MIHTCQLLCADKTICGRDALAEITLSAAGLQFKVPLCRDHHTIFQDRRKQPAKAEFPPQLDNSLFNSIFGPNRR